MFNFSKIKKAFEPVKDPQVLIAEIHNEFDTATERLLNEAKGIISKSDSVLIDKAKKLKALGFTQAREVNKADQQIKEKDESKKVADSILYYQQWYPNNKFITEKEVEKICKKYSLVCGEVCYYKGDVPEKNLLEIENFKLRDEEKTKRSSHDDRAEREHARMMMQALRSPLSMLQGQREPRYTRPENIEGEEKYYYTQSQFKICAPVKDFDTRNMIVSKNGYTLELEDPIVLQPVKNGYLVVSKWGLESKDESLVNEKMN